MLFTVSDLWLLCIGLVKQGKSGRVRREYGGGSCILDSGLLCGRIGKRYPRKEIPLPGSWEGRAATGGRFADLIISQEVKRRNENERYDLFRLWYFD